MFDADDGSPLPKTVAKEVPICRVHFCQMKRTTNRGDKTYYKCPSKGCRETAVMLKPGTAMPKLPVVCPVCGCGDDGTKSAKVDLVVEKLKTYFVEMACPTKGCFFRQRVARPDIQAQIDRRPNQDFSRPD